jgi:membrane protease YdiL (CAAX protease family)
MAALFKNRFFIAYLVIYFLFLVGLNYYEDYPVEEPLALAVVIGIIFTLVAHLASRNAKQLAPNPPFEEGERVTLALLVIGVTLILMVRFDSLLPGELQSTAPAGFILRVVRKVLTFVVIPYTVYRMVHKRNARDFGLAGSWREILSRRNLTILFSLAVVILMFQYFAGNGARPIREGQFSALQLGIAFPLTFVVLILEVGLVEEFFFRALLQSRLTAWMKSDVGGIVASGLLFGLAHAPGIYLRGAGAIDGLGTAPSFLTSIGFSIVALSVTSFFLGLMWARTRNLWLMMAIHATVDLLPSVPEFIQVWWI